LFSNNHKCFAISTVIGWHLLAGWDLNLLAAFGSLEVQVIWDTPTPTSSSGQRANHV
jgi:hypothetical protein